MNNIINAWINNNPNVAWLTKGIIQYNNIDLTSLSGATTGFMIQTGNDMSTDNILIQEYVSKIVDGWTVIDKRYWNRHLNFNLFIQWADNIDLIDKIHLLQQELNSPNWKLYITRNWVVYSYNATCTNIVVPSFSTTDDFVENIAINFLLTSPHWIIEEAVNKQTHEIANFQSIIQNVWNYKAYPKIMLIWTAWCNITNSVISIDVLWWIAPIVVTIAQTITNWDVLIVDYDLKIITLNWIDVLFDWFLAPLQVWFNVMNFTFTWTVALDVNILYNKTFL